MKKLFAFYLFSSLLLTGCSTDTEPRESASSENSSSSSTSQESSSSEASTKTESEIKQEILDSLQGTWKNANGGSFIISGNTLSFPDYPEGYEVVIYPNYGDVVYVKAKGFAVSFAEAGTSFPDIVDPYPNWTDLTDKTKDRFLVGQSRADSETTKKFVYYKE